MAVGMDYRTGHGCTSAAESGRPALEAMPGSVFWSNLNKLYTDKMLQMDFCVLDEQKTHDMYSQIRQNDNWGGWGFSNLRHIFRQLVSSTVSIISAIILTVGLFVHKSTGGVSFCLFEQPTHLFGACSCSGRDYVDRAAFSQQGG